MFTYAALFYVFEIIATDDYLRTLLNPIAKHGVSYSSIFKKREKKECDKTTLKKTMERVSLQNKR